MVTENSIVIVETTDHQLADITLIVHSNDEAMAQRLHALCCEAVRKAVEQVDGHRIPDESNSG